MANGHRAQVYSAAGEPVGATLRHADLIQSVAFSPDGRLVATASHDGTARVWDAGTGALLGLPLYHDQRMEFDAVRYAHVDPNISARMNRQNQVIYGPFASRGRVLLAGFDPRRPRLLITVGGDETVRAWDAATGEPVGPPMPLDGEPLSAELGPDTHVRVLMQEAGRGLEAKRLVDWDLAADPRPAGELRWLATLLSGRIIDAAGQVSPASAAEVRAAQDALLALDPKRYAYLQGGAMSSSGNRVAPD